MLDLPFAAGRFKGVYCDGTLSLVRDPDQYLRDCYRVLRPLGRLVIADIYLRQWIPDHEHPAAAIQNALQGARPLFQIMTAVEAAGFSIELIEDHTHRRNHMGLPAASPHGPKLGLALIVAAKF